ncbi:MAG: ergothioneine biosynthesis protein EgtB [Cytophagales bacterium]|nr:MAG: ergothioneine biosynthesis protein EgtB [Cytophagales bacterium]
MISDSPVRSSALQTAYQRVRQWSVELCSSLETDDYVVQPTPDVSPPKWHLGHTTWFWETFVLQPNLPGYRVFHDDFSFVFNSYYETVGRRVLRTQRGNMTRPTVAEVYRYRDYVDEHMARFLDDHEPDGPLRALIELGLNHEQQHQELLITDIKYILGHNPLFPALAMPVREQAPALTSDSVTVLEGVHTVGFKDVASGRFHFDNELGVHKVYLNGTTLAGSLVTNAEYIQFIESGGYRQFAHWLSDGWAWVKAQAAQAPLYWHKIDGVWHCYTFEGLVRVDPDAPVCHVNHYEADAYARWRGQTEPGTRLPTEFEWEAAATATPSFGWGQRWEWTGSAYLPYPGFATAGGAVGEYNGKFMSGQMVLRGASVATPAGHERVTYRNFFGPDKQWQFSGIRLVKP